MKLFVFNYKLEKTGGVMCDRMGFIIGTVCEMVSLIFLFTLYGILTSLVFNFMPSHRSYKVLKKRILS